MSADHGAHGAFDPEKHHFDHLTKRRKFNWWLQAQQRFTDQAYDAGLEAIAGDADKLKTAEGRKLFADKVIDTYWKELEKKGVKKPKSKEEQDQYLHALRGITEQRLRDALEEHKDNYLLQIHRAQTQEHIKYLINNHMPRLITPELERDLKGDGKKADKARAYALKFMGRESDLEDKTISALDAITSLERNYQSEGGQDLIEQHYKALDKKYSKKGAHH